MKRQQWQHAEMIASTANVAMKRTRTGQCIAMRQQGGCLHFLGQYGLTNKQELCQAVHYSRNTYLHVHVTQLLLSMVPPADRRHIHGASDSLQQQKA
jgi:hypothetical protein